MLTTIVIFMVIYFLAMLVISWFGRKNTSDLQSYLTAGKSAGVIMLMGALIGAQIGNGVVVGGAGEGAAIGISGAYYAIGCGLSYAFAAFALNHFVYKNGYLSMAEYMKVRYNSRIPGLIYSIGTAVMHIGIIAAQIMAGKALFSALGLNPTLGCVALTVVVVAYSQIAGLWGAMAASVVQTSIIIDGLFVALIIVLKDGAIGMITDAVASGAVPSTYTSMVGAYPLSTILVYVLPTAMAMLTEPAAYQRIVSAKTEKKSFWAHILSCIVIIPIAFMPPLIGMYGHIKFNASGNDAFFRVVMETMTPAAAAIIIVAVLAAVMSTIDCTFIAASQVWLKDIYKGFINPEVKDEKLQPWTGVINVALGVICTILALKSTSITSLLSNGYVLVCSTCMVPMAMGVLWKRGTTKAATWSAVVGLIFGLMDFFSIYRLPYNAITVFIPSLVVYIVVSLATKEEPAAAKQ